MSREIKYNSVLREYAISMNSIIEKIEKMPKDIEVDLTKCYSGKAREIQENEKHYDKQIDKLCRCYFLGVRYLIEAINAIESEDEKLAGGYRVQQGGD